MDYHKISVIFSFCFFTKENFFFSFFIYLFIYFCFVSIVISFCFNFWHHLSLRGILYCLIYLFIWQHSNVCSTPPPLHALLRSSLSLSLSLSLSFFYLNPNIVLWLPEIRTVLDVFLSQQLPSCWFNNTSGWQWLLLLLL